MTTPDRKKSDPKSAGVDVCLISGAYPPHRCGVGDHAARLAAALSRQGAHCTVLTGAGALAEKGVPVSVHPMMAHWRWTALGRLLRELRRARPDAVHLQYPASGYGRSGAPVLLFPLLAAILHGPRRVLTLHEFHMYTRLGKLRLWPMLICAHRIVVTNHADRRALRPWLSRRPGRVRVIPLGSNLETGADDAGPISEPPAPRHSALVHFGTVMPNKGWELILSTLKLLQERGRPFDLLVVGALEPRSYPFQHSVSEQIIAQGLSARVRFTGYLSGPAARAAMAGSSGVALQPYRGGASLNRSSLVALFRQGMAVVTTRPERPLEGLRDGEHLCFADPDPNALATAIEALGSRPDLLAKLRHGAARAARRFSWERIARQTLAVYKR